MKTIIFQGDSITDCDRKNTLHGMGSGYAAMADGYVRTTYCGEYKCINSGVSGDQILNLYTRAKLDVWNYEPDIISFYVGVNDVWAEFKRKNGVDPDRFEKVYDMLIEETIEKLNGVKIFLIAPFVLDGEKVDIYGETMKLEVYKRAELVKKIAKKHGLICVELQSRFDEAYKKCPDPTYWTCDGVHPTTAGHKIIADAWIEACEEVGS